MPLGSLSSDRLAALTVSRKLLSVPAALLRRERSEDAELLVRRHENIVLRRQNTGPVWPPEHRPGLDEPADRFWFIHRTFLPRPALSLAHRLPGHPSDIASLERHRRRTPADPRRDRVCERSAGERIAGRTL